MAYTGIYERTIFYNPVNKYSAISVKTSDRSIPEKARSAYRHRDNMIHFAAVGYELPRTDQVSMIFIICTSSFVLGIVMPVSIWLICVDPTSVIAASCSCVMFFRMRASLSRAPINA